MGADGAGAAGPVAQATRGGTLSSPEPRDRAGPEQHSGTEARDCPEARDRARIDPEARECSNPEARDSAGQ